MNGRNSQFPQCTTKFIGCEYIPTSNTYGSPQSCGLNRCAGAFDLSDSKALVQETPKDVGVFHILVELRRVVP